MDNRGTPHGVVDSVLDSVAHGAKSLVRSIRGGLEGVGTGVQTALDAPFQAVGGPEQPLHIADRLLDGGLESMENVVSDGAIQSLQIVGEGINKALNHPHEQFGIPPSLGGETPLAKFRFPQPPMMRR